MVVSQERFYRSLAIAAVFTVSLSAHAGVITDLFGNGSHLRYDEDFPDSESARIACEKYASDRGAAQKCSGSAIYPLWSVGWLQITPSTFNLGNFWINKCGSTMVFNKTTAACGNDADKGAPSFTCLTTNINPATGNAFYETLDLQSSGGKVAFSMNYNSSDKTWRYSYSDKLRFALDYIAFVGSDGKEIFFKIDNSATYLSTSGEGVLSKSGSDWVYTSKNNDRYWFTSSGRLKKLK